jgi:hypothetical protein
MKAKGKESGRFFLSELDRRIWLVSCPRKSRHAYGNEAGWATEYVWLFGEEKNFVAPPGI